MLDKSPIVRKDERYAITRLYVELTRILQGSLCRTVSDRSDGECSALTVIASAVAVGHYEGRPMNASKIAEYVAMPRATTMRRLEKLIECGDVIRQGNLYYISPSRASGLPKATIDEMVRKIRHAYRALP